MWVLQILQRRQPKLQVCACELSSCGDVWCFTIYKAACGGVFRSIGTCCVFRHFTLYSQFFFFVITILWFSCIINRWKLRASSRWTISGFRRCSARTKRWSHWPGFFQPLHIRRNPLLSKCYLFKIHHHEDRIWRSTSKLVSQIEAIYLLHGCWRFLQVCGWKAWSARSSTRPRRCCTARSTTTAWHSAIIGAQNLASQYQ